MADKFPIYLVLIAGSLILDALVRPRRAQKQRFLPRSFAGSWLHMLVVSTVFGAIMVICGHALASALLTFSCVALFTTISNAKRAMLGEPLVFSDLALIGAVFHHPQFYLSALRPVQKMLIVLAAASAPAVMWWLFVPALAAHGAGLALMISGPTLIWLSMHTAPWTNLALEPDVEADVARHGLIATLLLYWLRWRQTTDPVPLPSAIAQASQGGIAVVIQCESFADPAELFGDASLALPGLEAARTIAWQWGDLLVGGFGAYTMRTEYGVLFGRDEEALGFRRFDPFLTALGESTFALPARLAGAGWRSLFLHPHDMRFYNREQIMRAGGFAELIGEDRFAPPKPGAGRYVTDAAMADVIADVADAAELPTLVYAVTIENHGPWEADAGDARENLKEGYLRLVGNSDAMLSRLISELSNCGNEATLAFFGDHRPSIPGVSMPGGPRHTPYVIVRFDAAGQVIRDARERIDLTPAQLHHVLADLLTGSPSTCIS